MSDRSIAVQNFRWGLESRRSELITQPGALASIVDGHINEGGEIEQRAGFILFAQLYLLTDSNGDQGVFGLEATGRGPTVFGSALPNGASVVFNQPTLAQVLPTTNPQIVYQQLQHPEIYDQVNLTSDIITTVNYDRTKHRMTAVVYSVNFEGKALALAKFADGNTFMYYNGALVQHSRNGRVTANQATLAALSNDAARQVRALQAWTSTPNTGTAPLTNGSTAIYSPGGVHYTMAASQVCAGDGLIGLFDSQSLDQPGTIGTSASVKFTFSGFATTSGNITITAPKSNVNPTIITLVDYTPSSRTPAQVATDLSVILNRLTSNIGYFASTDGAGAITIFSPTAWGNFTGTVTVTSADSGVTITAAAGATSGGLAVVVTSVSRVDTVNGSTRTKLVVVNATAHPTGGTGTYTKFFFQDVTPGGSVLTITPAYDGATNQGQTVSFSKVLSVNQSVNALIKCTVTDSTPLTATCNFNVYLELDSNA